MNRPCVRNSVVTEAGRFTNRPYGRGVVVIDGLVLSGVGARVRFITPCLLMVYKYGSDARVHAADCYANSSYGFNRQSRRGDS